MHPIDNVTSYIMRGKQATQPVGKITRHAIYSLFAYMCAYQPCNCVAYCWMTINKVTWSIVI